MSINAYPNNVDARVKKLIDVCFPLKSELDSPVDLNLTLNSTPSLKLKSRLNLNLNLNLKKYPLKRSTQVLQDFVEEIEYEE